MSAPFRRPVSITGNCAFNSIFFPFYAWVYVGARVRACAVGSQLVFNLRGMTEALAQRGLSPDVAVHLAVNMYLRVRQLFWAASWRWWVLGLVDRIETIGRNTAFDIRRLERQVSTN